MSNNPRIILASTSLTRINILKKLSINFQNCPPEVNEKRKDGESARDMSLRLSLEKSLSISKKYSGAIVIGSDQVAECDGRILNKPQTEVNAIKQLIFQRGKKTKFFTGIAISQNKGEIIKSTVVESYVEFLAIDLLTEDLIKAYVKNEKPLNCAGSAKFEGTGICLIKKVSTEDPNALLGLPVIKLCMFLNELGYHPFDLINQK